MKPEVVSGPEQRIIQLLESNLMSTSELAKKLDMRRDVLAGYLEALMHQGKLEKIRVGRSNVFIPVKHTRRIGAVAP